MQRYPFLFPWFAFLSAGGFLALMLPIGEGFDELAHFGYIQYVAQVGRLPLTSEYKAFPSYEIAFFLRRQPVGWSAHIAPRFRLASYESYWQLNSSDRAIADASVEDLHFSNRYAQSVARFEYPDEAHQPPLYYLLAAPLFRL